MYCAVLCCAPSTPQPPLHCGGVGRPHSRPAPCRGEWALNQARPFFPIKGELLPFLSPVKVLPRSHEDTYSLFSHWTSFDVSPESL